MAISRIDRLLDELLSLYDEIGHQEWDGSISSRELRRRATMATASYESKRQQIISEYNVLLSACKAANKELERLVSVLLPHYEGKIGAPDLFVMELLKSAIDAVTEN